VGNVQYGYYSGGESHGETRDLRLVTITMPLIMTDSGISSVRKKHYWYYEGTYNATTNPGYHHQIQYIIDFEGYRGYDWDQDSNLDDDTLSATEANLKPYASAYFAHDTERRIVSAWFNGACGCSGASTGTHSFEYETNGSYSDGSGYDTAWKGRTIVKKPTVDYKTAEADIESWLTQYFDEVGQPLHRVQTALDPDETTNQKYWVTHVTRNADGQVTQISSPANVTASTHASASFTTSTSAGLVTTFTRFTSGDTRGFVSDTKHLTGTSGSAYLDGTVTLSGRSLTVGDFVLTRPFLASRRVYTEEVTSGTSGSHLTSLGYTFWSGTSTLVQYLAPKVVTTTNPAVSSGNNGSGSATTSKRYIRKDGSTAFAEAEDGVLTYTLFADGQLTKRIDDARTNHATDFAAGDDPSGDFGITETGDGVRRITTHAYDQQGRSDTVTASDGRVMKRYYSRLSDHRLVTLGYADFESGTPKFHGPVSYTVANHAGRAEVQATVALTNNESTTALTGHVDETDADPITAMDLGTVARMATSIFDESGGVLEESRAYFDVPASGAGADGTNYDPTAHGYDDQGRQVRVKAPHGTINRTSFDTLGRAVSQWIGTNDSSFDGGESSGTDNMVKVSATEFDSGGDKANSYVTKQTLFTEDSSANDRETTYTNDVRGRALLVTAPTAPHAFNKFDNMGRLIASGQFSSTGSITVGSDDPTTETANRLALSQTFFDELGRAWKSQFHKIDDADGSDDDNLQTLTWFDAAGHVIKVDGSQLTKAKFDRLGRQTHSFVLASDNDSVYADADDVAGDFVLLESQTVYESTDSDDVVMTGTISRFHDDLETGTTGVLDTNADGDSLMFTAANIEGRIQITASWYDRFGRLTDQALYGTNGGSDFERDGLSAPSRSDTILLTEYEFNTDGTLLEVTDPKALKTRYLYDEAGRQIAVIANYVTGSGVPSGPNGDDDNFVRYVYTDGLQTKMWVDLDGDNVEDAGPPADQVTRYIYGTTKGTTAGLSKIATGHLLRATIYPDSTNAGTTTTDIDSDDSDVVALAYNAQGQELRREDQDGNVIETVLDDSGRVLHKRVTTIDEETYDDDVLRISTVYDSLGRVSTVTQYTSATPGSGSVTDEAKFTYDDWGPISRFEQDHDSTVATGGNHLYDLDYVYAKATTGRNTIRRTSLALPDGTTVNYEYLSTGDLHDGDASRVSQLVISSVAVAAYGYNGVAQVVGTDYPEIDVMWHQYGSSGTYPDLDRFDRVTTSKWTKDLGTDRDFFDTDVTYDRNSNPTVLNDSVHAGVDMALTYDNRNRLTNAEEGTWNGSAITSKAREQKWTELSQTGNWERAKLDVNGDGDFTDSAEYDDDRTHNAANEITLYSPPGLSNKVPTYQATGNLTDDQDDYEYLFDAFGRMRYVKNTSDQSVVSEHRYNGLGHRIYWHYDVDADNDVDASDPEYWFVHDERWRIVATYRGTDGSAKERFIYHNAGDDGFGGASYIDDVVLRDKDANTAWSAASDGTLEERIYYCHNWRHDVVAMVDDGSNQIEQARYLAYGIPDGFPAADLDSDGDCDSADLTVFDGLGGYDVRADLNLDGDNDSGDRGEVVRLSGSTLGYGALSLAGVGNRKGYAGYERASELSGARVLACTVSRAGCQYGAVDKTRPKWLPQ
jgi:YD repeat-containing protein